MVHTPGLVRWGINGWWFPEDRPAIENVFAQTFNLPFSVVRALLSTETPYSVEDDTVVFTIEDGE